jgi:hypothetical protein
MGKLPSLPLFLAISEKVYTDNGKRKKAGERRGKYCAIRKLPEFNTNKNV